MVKADKCNYRTTFALDGVTQGRLESLSESWGVSKAEVVRRSVALADSQRGALEKLTSLKPRIALEVYEEFLEKGGLDSDTAEKWCSTYRAEK